MSLLKAGVLFFVLLCLTACGRQVVEFGEDAGTTTAPTVISTMPVDGATGVAVDALVSATFSRAMDASTLGATTFTVSQRTAKIAGQVTLDALTNTATFTPAASLEPGLIYSATISARVTDSAGVALDAAYTWRFTTRDGAVDEPPTVIATTPPDEASDVATNTELSATFSEAMDDTTITVDTFLLMQDTTPISGSVTFDPASNVATFVPDSELDPQLVYTATISSDVEDSGGTRLAADYTWTFTTGGSVDVLPPTVISTLPADDATDVPLVAAISATFSEAMDAATINTTSYTLRRGATNVTGAVALDPSTNTATFTPAALLLANTVYTATISTGASDLEGNPLAKDYSFNFTTAADAVPPTVTAVSPVDSASDVPVNEQLTALFSKAMDPATISSTSFSLKRGASNVTGAVSLDPLTNVATFAPTAALAADTVYTATISTDAEDLGGTPLAANYTWSFTTAAAVVAPTVISTTPINLATNVSIDVKPTARFSEAMAPATISATTFTLKRGATSVVGVVSLDPLTNIATFAPTAALAADTVYTATISTGAEDLDGTALAANYTWSFTTAASVVAPTVISTTPINLATNVSINVNPTARFSQPMAPTTISATTFTLKRGATSVVGVVSLDPLTNIATFAPSAALAANTVYTATISTGAEDLGGTALAANYTWSFTTAASVVAPTVISTTPINLATNVPINVNPTAKFSQPMDPTAISATTFTLARGATNVVGVVTLNALTNTATFTPTAPLLANTVYTATISTGAKDVSGTPLAASYNWSFTTAVAPTVSSTAPVNLATNVPLNVKPTATFSKAMDSLTISVTTFTLKRGATSVVGVVTLNAATNTATFTPAAPLLANTVYTATISTGAEDVSGTPLATNYTWSFTTAVAPTVSSTTPVNLATNVLLDVKPTATFSKAMDSLTISVTTFTLKRGATSVVGVVTLNAATNTATFTPAAPLLANTVYTATISAGAKDLGGTPLAASYTWSFTTAAAVAPTVISTTPINLATNVSINVRPSTTFSTSMDPATITALTFTLKQGLLSVAGSVTYNALTRTATFTPNNPLGVNLVYTLTVTTGAKDLAGTPLASDHSQSFTTAACSQAPVVLGAASGFVVLAGSTVTNTGLTVITGNLGVSPGTAVTGFPPGILIGTLNAGNSTAAQGIAALTIAYNDAAGRTLCPVTVAGNLGGQTLTPGLYKSTSSLAVSSGDLTLDAQGQGDAIFVFQMATTLTMTAGRQVILTNGAKAANIYWQVGTSATLGTTSVFQGTIMADQAITLGTGATMNGRALARIAGIALDSNTIVTP